MPDTETLSTNELLDRVIKDVDLLIGHAEADADGSMEIHAKVQEKDDRGRVTLLRKAKALLDDCHK